MLPCIAYTSWYFQPGISASLSKPCQRGENFNWMLLPTWYYSPSHQTNSIFMQKFFIQYNQIFSASHNLGLFGKISSIFRGNEIWISRSAFNAMERLSFPVLVWLLVIVPCREEGRIVGRPKKITGCKNYWYIILTKFNFLCKVAFRARRGNFVAKWDKWAESAINYFANFLA